MSKKFDTPELTFLPETYNAVRARRTYDLHLARLLDEAEQRQFFAADLKAWAEQRTDGNCPAAEYRLACDVLKSPQLARACQRSPVDLEEPTAGTPEER